MRKFQKGSYGEERQRRIKSKADIMKAARGYLYLIAPK